MATWYVRVSDIGFGDDPHAFTVTRVFDEQGNSSLPVIALKVGDAIEFLDMAPAVGLDTARTLVIDSLINQERGYVKVIPRALPPLRPL